MANVVSMKQLLEAGVHFGHATRKWNPKMKKYIYTARNDIHIINLEKTVGLIDEAYAFIKSVVAGGKNVLFVGTKKQAHHINQMESMNEFSLLPKKEVLKLIQTRDKLEANLGGIKEMRTLPGALFVVDPKKEHIAISEARSLGIPIVSMVDTNCDPDVVDYVIPSNDDAIRAIKLIASAMADAVIEAREGEEALAEKRAAAAKTEEPAAVTE